MKSAGLNLFLSLLFLSVFSSSARDRLVDLNKYWSRVDRSAYCLSALNELSEKALIQFHLLEVIDSLNRVDLSEFDADQKTHRTQLLDRLRIYAEKGVFPKNTYHQKRTPYFIDDFGTACAVGYMIIESGNQDLALKVSNEMNYDYIEDMPYPELGKWAHDHGFKVNELKWIQPGYGPQCAPGQVIQPVCAQPSFKALGCFNPDWQADSLVPPLTYLTEYNIGNGWVVDSFNTWQSWGAQPGQYRITITDFNQSSRVYNYHIIAPPPLLSNDSVMQHSTTQSSCDGRLQVNAANGLAPYQITLMNQSLNYISSNSSGTFDSLCPGTYTIIINDANNCQGQDSARIELITGLNEYSSTDHLQFQNPLRAQELHLKTALKGKKMLSVYNLKGELIHQEAFSGEQLNSFLNVHNGLYIIELSNAQQRLRKKLIVHN